jgi:hypothetical protein
MNSKTDNALRMNFTANNARAYSQFTYRSARKIGHSIQQFVAANCASSGKESRGGIIESPTKMTGTRPSASIGQVRIRLNSLCHAPLPQGDAQSKGSIFVQQSQCGSWLLVELNLSHTLPTACVSLYSMAADILPTNARPGESGIRGSDVVILLQSKCPSWPSL